jgi:hypothetical protein
MCVKRVGQAISEGKITYRLMELSGQSFVPLSEPTIGLVGDDHDVTADLGALFTDAEPPRSQDSGSATPNTRARCPRTPLPIRA